MFKIDYREIEDCTLLLMEISGSPDELLSELSNNDLKQLEQVTSQKRKREIAAKNILLSKAFGSDVKLSYNELGKPILSNGFYISITHSDKWIAIYFNKEREVGIDIEKIGSKIDRVKQRFLSSNELEWIKGECELSYLHILWSAKEAVYKMLNSVGVDFRTDILIQPFDIGQHGTIKAETKKGTITLSYEINSNYVMVYSK